jgi:NADPH:quinone reductase-like Zn-dependent oxidoreductase
MEHGCVPRHRSACAEYFLVEETLVEPKPESINFIEGSAIADSPVNAMLALEDAAFKPGDRILVIGGSGAVGGSIIQMARTKGASYIAATSTAADLVKSLGADEVIDYRNQAWWEVQDWKEHPFDIIFDCAEGRTAWQHACKSKVLRGGRKGGRFIAIVPQECAPHSSLAFPWQKLRLHLQRCGVIWMSSRRPTLAPAASSTLAARAGCQDCCNLWRSGKFVLDLQMAH